MAKHKEVRIPFAELTDPQTITERVEQAFHDADRNIHVHEVAEVEGVIDDHHRQERVVRIKNIRYFDMGGRR